MAFIEEDLEKKMYMVNIAILAKYTFVPSFRGVLIWNLAWVTLNVLVKDILPFKRVSSHIQHSTKVTFCI